jgi:hypothetical protein
LNADNKKTTQGLWALVSHPLKQLMLILRFFDYLHILFK